jgi:glucose-6-phosphate-specific signal transduction histidine kinase
MSTPVKSIASWIGESLAATAVVVICLGIPSVFDLPLWTLALSAIPILFYLSWRLDRERFSWPLTLLMAVVLSAVVLIHAYVVPERWRSVSLVVTVLCISILASWLRRKRKETHHVG